MKKLKAVIFANIFFLFLGGIGGYLFGNIEAAEAHDADTKAEDNRSREFKAYPPEESKLKNIEECWLCGSAEGSVLSMFKDYEDLGIICVNEWHILDMRIRNHDESGNLTGPQGYINATRGALGEGKYTYYCRPNSDRGISEVTVYYGNEVFDVKKAKKRLCQSCLDKVLDVMKVYAPEDEPARPRDLCLVDFQTLELYSLQGDRSSYFAGDYYVQIDDSRKEELCVSAIYAPVLEYGEKQEEIAETGNHEELMERQGSYYELYQAQAQHYA